MSRRALTLFIALGLLWGIPYAFIKIAVQELTPEALVFIRTALAAAVLLPIAAWRGELRRVVRFWKPLLAYTVVEIVFPWYFINAAEQRLSSSTVALMLATIPLVGVPVGIIFKRAARLTWHNWAGMAVGLAGVAALVGLDVGRGDPVGIAQLLVAILGYAIGPVIMARWLPDAPGLAVVALSFAISAVVYLPVVGVTGGFPTSWPSPAVVTAVLILATLCSGLAFVVMFALVAEIGPLRMTAATYLNTAIAVVLGAVMLSEPITLVTLLGFILVVGGSYLVTRNAAAKPTPAIGYAADQTGQKDPIVSGSASQSL